MDTSSQSTSVLNEHLTFPSTSDSAETPVPVPPQPRPVLKDRLYVGNLHQTVDEYTLLQVFSKFGKVSKLDFLFHKTGALRGKPRGYAFIEYSEETDALKALSKAHGKLLRGRKLVVTFAHQAPLDLDLSGSSTSLRHRRTATEAAKPTTLSLIKSGMNDRRHTRTEDKIAMMEAKLRQLESSKQSSEASTSTAVPVSLHPSLPTKPPPLVCEVQGSPSGVMSLAGQERQRTHSLRPPTSLPSLPIKPPSQKPAQGQSGSSSSLQPRPRSKLAGVKILKPREK
ncbi:hypothetical protein AX15_002393 [Amanita polypyramis BW_CC]|nr:hypothetical protein AX15_002393 [Amanita polypyramis BW_CC]